MDKRRYEILTKDLLEKTYKTRAGRTRAARLKRLGIVEEAYDESQVLKVKPRPQHCEDCDLIIVNTLKVIYRDEKKPNRWIKRCAECGEKSLFRGDKKN